ncbi:MAG: zinc-ribbon domain-containing protein, partial [Gemmataceae bacterium]|nr:zinc-ribbon domain-containing protein [Gemmataceae bacterium]
MASVKVSCPSCEATVLVKDPKLIGSKVECPKCKYRFKAEAPAEPTADGPAPAAAGKKKAAKAAKGEGGGRNKKLLLGVGAAVAAVALLGIGGYVLFGGGDDKKPSGGGTAGGPRPAAGTKGTTAPKAGGDEAGDGKEEGKEDAPKVPAAPPLARSDKDPTNLLPNDSVAVYRFDLRKLRQSPIGQQLFDPAVVDLMRTATGLEPAQLDRYIHCVVGEEKRAPFGVLRLREPVREADLVGRLAGVGPAAKVNGKDLHPVSGNPFLAAVGNALSARSVLGDLYEAPYAAAAGEKTAPDRAAPLGACAYDTQTLLVGDYATVERFLAGLKDGYPDFLTEFRREALPPPPGEEAEEDDTPAKKDAGKKDAGKKDPKEPAPPPKAAPAGPAREFTANPTYLSVTPELKQLLNTLEADPPPTGSSLVLMAERWDDARYPRAGVKKEYEPVVRVVDAVLSKTRYLGATLWSLEHRRLVGTVRILTTNPEEARSLALDKIGPGLEKGATLLGLMLSNPIAVRNEAAPTQPKDGGAPGAGFPGRLTGPGGFGGPPGMTGPPPGLG